MYGIDILDNPSKYFPYIIERVNVFAQETSTCHNMCHISLGHYYVLIEIRKICILTKNINGQRNQPTKIDANNSLKGAIATTSIAKLVCDIKTFPTPLHA